MQRLMAYGLDLEMLVGQAHTLNLVLAHSCEVSMIRNCIGTVKSVINFFRQSALRDGLLKEAAESIGASHSNLISLCETRWSEKHLAIERFAEMYSIVFETLQVLQNSSRDYASQAYQLRLAIESSQFVISLLIMRKVFSYTSNLNKVLQTINIDLIETCKYVNSIRKTFEEIQNDEEYLKIIIDAKTLMGTESIQAPRVTARQTGRNNIPADTAEIYYKRNIFYPFLDHMQSELAARFSQHHERIGSLRLLLPAFIKDENRALNNLKEMQEMYLPNENIENVLSEYRLWCIKWKENNEELTAIETFEKCNKHFFPLIHKLLKILATLPVSTSTAERSFSTLKS
ncbi:uncharacterized protein LOC126553633 [Aphis gossypii]|uniref:uncharacterized protein LOC126553633 n=1 Tax=Aphis gossypii TaxID=80765 RepID=UPI0021591D6C|nr:uncharacterized protein LOC126553633 [Aphis gossypii]